jgi:hypothetical protein
MSEIDDAEKFPERRWVDPRDGEFHELYCNFIHASWTLFDVRLRIGQLIPAEGGDAKNFVAEEQGAVTMPWPQAKNLRDLLDRLVKSYEQVNGEIKLLKLPPDPTVR